MELSVRLLRGIYRQPFVQTNFEFCRYFGRPRDMFRALLLLSNPAYDEPAPIIEKVL